ncbi:hypothetical protein CBL_00692 [Carabus blaptoides fortunei]
MYYGTKVEETEEYKVNIFDSAMNINLFRFHETYILRGLSKRKSVGRDFEMQSWMLFSRLYLSYHQPPPRDLIAWNQPFDSILYPGKFHFMWMECPRNRTRSETSKARGSLAKMLSALPLWDWDVCVNYLTGPTFEFCLFSIPSYTITNRPVAVAGGQPLC